MRAEQQRRALKAIMPVEQTRSSKLKGRTVADGSAQHPYIQKDEVASPTVSQEELFLTCIAGAFEAR